MTAHVILELFAFLVLLAVAHTLIVGPTDRPGPADRAFADHPELHSLRSRVA